jgi:hypothetical protein
MNSTEVLVSSYATRYHKPNDHILTSEDTINKKFWDELLAYFPLTRHGWLKKRRVQKLFYCCLCIRCRGNVLPSRCLATIVGYTYIHKD